VQGCSYMDFEDRQLLRGYYMGLDFFS